MAREGDGRQHSRWGRSAPPHPGTSADRLLESAESRTRTQPRFLLLGEAGILLAVIGLLDYATGAEISFSIFYLTPVVFATWFVGKRAGITLAVLSAAVWLYFEMTTGRGYESVIAPYWNSLVRLGFFMITLLLLERVKKAAVRERALARTDPLTQVANGRAFEDRAQVALGMLRRNGRPLTVAYFDLDHFKTVNDRFGHSEGDQVLRAVTSTVDGRLRNTDMLARLGGDEFALLLPETDAAGAARLLDGVVSSLSRTLDGRWAVGMTMGAVTLLDAPDSIDDVVKLADALMYEGKRDGRGKLVHRTWNSVDGLIDPHPVAFR